MTALTHWTAFASWAQSTDKEELRMLDTNLPAFVTFLEKLSMFPDRDAVVLHMGTLIASYADSLVAVGKLKIELSEQAPTITALSWEVHNLEADNAALREQIKKLLEEKRAK